MFRIASLLALLLPIPLPAEEPRINPAFPVDERNISPPILFRPIHDCARVVHVAGFISNATIHVFANGIEVGKGTSPVGEGDITLSRALAIGEVITARQVVNSVQSGDSDPVTVDAYPAKLTTPVVGRDVYACGRVVPVDNLEASTRVQVTDASAAGSPVIGSGDTAGHWFPVVTGSLVKDHMLFALQLICPDSSHPGTSPPSAPIRVKASPATVPKPVIDPKSVVVQGTTVLVLQNLLPGAEIEIKANSTVLSSGLFATSSSTWFSLNPPVPPGHPKITAVQKLCTPSLPSDPVIAVDTITPPEIGPRICAGSRFVSIDKTVLNANVVLLRRNAANPTPQPIGYGGAVMGTLQMRVGKGVTLNAGDILTARQYIGSIVSDPSPEVVVGCDGGANVITQHNDNFRTGSYLAENALTPKSVGERGMQRYACVNLNGRVVTQPLYVREVPFFNGGANGVFVATMKNSVYALDANNHLNTKWRVDLADSDPAKRPVAQGIDTTPVIDPANNRIYVLFRTANGPKKSDDYKTNADAVYWLVALDIRNRNELARTAIAGSVFARDGSVRSFIAKNHTAHPALLLDHGSIYVAFGSEAGSEGQPEYLKKYSGWVMKYRASDLVQQAVFCTSPGSVMRPNKFAADLKINASGIWHGGGGLAADPDGNIYFLTGNGRWDPPNDAYGDGFLKLTPLGNFFVPNAFAPGPSTGDPDVDLLETGDADLASGGPLVIPGTNQIIGGGKTGWMYLLDRTAMLFQQRITASTSQYPTPHQRWEGWNAGPHLHGSPTFWQGTGRLYTWGEKDFLRSFPLNAATKRFDESAAHQGPFPALELPMPGGMMSISAKGADTATGVLWAIVSIDNFAPESGQISRGRLYAFDARNLRPLWDKQFGTVPHWAPPMIADSKVYVPTFDEELVAYELGPDANNLGWHPYVPHLQDEKCGGCHQPAQLQDLRRRYPLSARFTNEASVWTRPARAWQILSPPAGARKVLTVEGTGTQTYVAVNRQGRLVWSLKETSADLVELGPDGEPKKEGAVRVTLAPGFVWSASDGSRLSAQVQTTTPAPSAANAPWTLFRAVSSGGSGILNGVTYVQCVYTHAGHSPGTAPTAAGQSSRVPYVAQYWFYR